MIDSEPGARSFKMVLEYDGSDFCGWQVQPGQRTVQEEIEKAVHRITGEKRRLTGAGRTDAGVHALGQVASIRLACKLGEDRLQAALNAVLPHDVRVLEMCEMPGRFDARRDAVSRSYRYVISKRLNAVGRQYAWFPSVKYDLAPMMTASNALMGRHVWRTFSKSGAAGCTFVSTVTDIRWQNGHDEIWFDITAERFFHNMVRIVLGTLFDVGRGRMTIDGFRRLFELNDRKQAGITLPPRGLFLVKVDYQQAKEGRN
jgi:tRNA pseudouridine38-40 synthase